MTKDYLRLIRSSTRPKVYVCRYPNYYVIIAAPSESLGGLYRLIPGELHVRLTGASYPINPTHCRGIMCGARGPVPAAAVAMVGCCLFSPGVGCSTKSHVCKRPKILDK